jgi:uncharacterized protein
MHDRHPTPPDTPPEPPVRRSLPHLLLAYTCIGLGIIGAVLPLLPTTPFLLVAAWAAARGSPSLHHWLYQHPRLGAPLIAWEQKRAVPAGAKWLACVFMSISWVIMLVQTSGPFVPVLTGAVFVCVAIFLLSRPSA